MTDPTPTTKALTLTDAATIRRLAGLASGERVEVRLVMKHPPQQMPNYGEINKSGHDLHLWKQDRESFGIIGLSPFGWPGEQRRLWVRETWGYWEQPDEKNQAQKRGEPIEDCCKRLKNQGRDYVKYFADGALWPFPKDQGHPCMNDCIGKFGKKLSAESMPHWASRIHLTVIDCRVEQVDGVWVWVGTVERSSE